QDLLAVFGVGEVAEVSPFVDESNTARVDHDAERVGVFLKTVANREVTEFRGICIPTDCMATRPVAARRCANIDAHPDAVAGIEACAAAPRETPPRTEVTGPPCRIRFE